MKTNLPPYWQIERLGDVCVEIIGGGTPSTNKNEFWDGNIPWITSADISGIREVVIRKKTNENGIKNSSTNLLPKGSIIVVTRVGLGKIAIAPCDLCFSQDCQGLILKNEVISNSYALYFLSKAVQVFKYESRGTTINGVTKKQLVNLQIPVPPLPEQEQIVAKIEELFSELDAGVENIKTAQEQLKVYRQSLLKWAFEGKLTNEDVKDGELPEGWKKMKVSEVAETFGGYAFKSSSFVRNGKYQVIRMGNIRPGVLRLNENPVFVENTEDIKVMRSLLIYNDILITQTGTKGKKDYGYTVLVKKDNLLLNQRIACIRCGKKCLPGFFLYYSWTDKFRDQFFSNETGNVGQGNVGMKAITDSFVYIPPLPEQLKIVEELESRLTVCDNLEEDIKFSLARAESLRQSILKQAFEGKLLNFKGETDK